jgi:hypothetical protein
MYSITIFINNVDIFAAISRGIHRVILRLIMRISTSVLSKTAVLQTILRFQ